MSFCRNCGKELKTGWKACPYCGKAANVCNNCGKELQDDWKTCPFCGTAAENDAPQTMPAATAAQLAQNSAEDYKERGLAYYKQNQFDLAIGEFNEAIRLDPNNGVAYSFRGDAYYAQKQFDLAIRDYSEVIRLEPKHAVFFTSRRGDSYAALNEFDAAFRDYNEAIRLDPNNANAYKYRGYNIFNQNGLISRAGEPGTEGLFQLVLDDFNEFIRLAPKEPVDYYFCFVRGLAYKALGKTDLAIGEFERALALNPDYPMSKLELQQLRGY